MLGANKIWGGRSIVEAWKAWVDNQTEKDLTVLPLLVCWGIWLARNTTIFEDKVMLLEISVTN